MLIKYIVMAIILLITNNQHLVDNNNNYYQYIDKEVCQVFDEIPEISNKVIDKFNGPMTAYGPDCKGCTTGYTASGYYVKDNIYYEDSLYGKVRIVAADRSLSFGTIIRISNLDVFEQPILVIVLDRGSAIGFNKKTYFDLLYPSEKETEFFGCRQATFEILREGF